MGELVELDVTTVEESVTVNVTEEGQVQVAVFAEKGDTGPAGPAGPNSVTSATTSDGTAELEVLLLTTAEGITANRGVNETSAIYADGGNGNAIYATSEADAVIIASDNGTALTVTSNTGNDIAVFRDASQNGINIENPRGWLTWVYEPGEIYLGRLKTADITDDREWTLPDRSGNVALTEDYTAGTATIDVLDATVQGTLTADHIHGNLAGSVYAHIRAGENLAKGDPVYISGSHGSGANLIAIVSKADASNAAKMPAVGVMDAAVTSQSNGHMVITGTITELNTNAYPVNTVLYVATGGGWTSTPPAANSQAVAVVERSNANNGAVIVKVNGLGSSGGNGAADANKLVRYNSTGGASLTGGTLTNPTVTNYTESVVVGGNTGASQTLALTSGTLQTWTLTGNCTFTMPTADAGKSFSVLLRSGAGGFTATFTGVRWASNVAPVFTPTASRLDIVSFVSDGTNWYGTLSQNHTV